MYSIIGAGIGGLMTAIAFEKAHIEYQVFERVSSFGDVGAGIWLSPNALQVLDYFGLLQEVQQNGNSIDRITIGLPDLSPISDSPQEAIKERFGYSTIAIHRGALQKILVNNIPREKLHFEKSFSSIENSQKNITSIFFEDGSSVKTNFIIGADGIHSKVRQHIFPNSKTRYSGQTCWRGIAHTTLDSEFDHRVYELWGNQIRFGISRISEGQYYWFAVALDEANKKDNPSETKIKLLAMFETFDSSVLKLIASTPDDKILRNDILDLNPLNQWHKNNICLIGDAGHATTPNMGQGGAQAIEDAYYLSHIIKQNSCDDTFQQFQKKRFSKVNSIVKQSWTTGKIAHWKYGKRIRNMIFKSIPNKLVIKKMLDMYEIDKFEL